MNVIYSKDKNGLYNNKINRLHVNVLGTVYSDFGLHFFKTIWIRHILVSIV